MWFRIIFICHFWAQPIVLTMHIWVRTPTSTLHFWVQPTILHFRVQTAILHFWVWNIILHFWVQTAILHFWVLTIILHFWVRPTISSLVFIWSILTTVLTTCFLKEFMLSLQRTPSLLVWHSTGSMKLSYNYQRDGGSIFPGGSSTWMLPFYPVIQNPIASMRWEELVNVFDGKHLFLTAL